MAKKVIILGGGIGGLSTAHELSKNPEYEIHLYERNSELGGQARSSLNIDKQFSEICWHAFSSGYRHFLKILDEVTDNKGIKVISHLKPLDKFIYAFDEKNYIEYENSFITRPHLTLDGFKSIYKHDILFSDKVKLLFIYLRANTICQARVEKYDNVLWKDYIAGLSPEIKRWALDSTSIYLGMDYAKLSTQFVFHFMRTEHKSNLLDNTHLFYALDGPMDEVLFDVWHRYLKNKGVHFHLNHTIKSVDIQSNNLTEIKIQDDDGCKQTISGDIFINALGAEQLAYLFPTDNNKMLAANGRQIQTQVLYYLPYRLQPVGTPPTIIIFPDTAWFLMTRIESDLWEINCDLLSTGIGMWDVKGLNGKTATECNREELAIECWDQICNSKHNLKLSDKMPVYDIWYSYQYNNETKQMDTFEPKFSNNINTYKYRPDYKDKLINNLYHATAYAKTNMDVYNMESAAEAGFQVSRLIEKKELYTYNQNVNWFFKFCRWVDKLFFSCC